MKRLTPFAMLLAVLATAVVGVCEQAEVRHHEYRVWSLERRRAAAERQIQRLEAAARAARAPRVLLGASVDPTFEPGAAWTPEDAGSAPGTDAEPWVPLR